MQRIILGLFWAAIMTGSVSAQPSSFQFADDPFATGIDGPRGTSPESTDKSSSSTSDKYRSFEQAMDAKSLVQRNATLRADQRRRRLATKRWFGYSSSRPIVAASPFMTHYSPLWMSNPWMRNPWMPYAWYGAYWR